MKYLKLYERFRNDRKNETPINEGCFDMLSTEDINMIVNEDDLNSAMKMAQDIIGQTDGGVCGVYWSEFEDPDQEWESLNPDERLYHLQKYMEVEDSYKGLKESVKITRDNVFDYADDEEAGEFNDAALNIEDYETGEIEVPKGVDKETFENEMEKEKEEALERLIKDVQKRVDSEESKETNESEKTVDFDEITTDDEFKGASAYIYAGTISGDGYSDPTFSIHKTLEEAVDAQQEDINIQVYKPWVENGAETKESMDEGREEMGLHDVAYEIEDDYWRFRVVPVKTNKRFILLWYYEPNEVEIIEDFDTMREAMESLDEYGKKIDDLNEIDDRLVRNGHGHDFYEHYQIFEIPK